MTIVVEDGTGLANANSYASVAEADTYLTLRGITSWSSLQQAEKEAALVRATDYMPIFAWQGIRSVNTQALDWPRTYVYVRGALLPSPAFPTQIKTACIELAWRGASGPLNPDINVGTDDTGRMIIKKVERVGPIDEETTYASRGQMALPVKPVWSAVIALVRDYTSTQTGVIR